MTPRHNRTEHHSIALNKCSQVQNRQYSFKSMAGELSKRYSQAVKKDTSCWNCGHNSHTVAKCRKPLNPKAIALRKAKFFQKKRDSRNASKRVLHELVEGLEELFETGDSQLDEEYDTLFGAHDSDSDSDTESSGDDVAPDEPEIGFASAKSSEDSDLGF